MGARRRRQASWRVVTPSEWLPSLPAGFWRARLQQLEWYTRTRIRAITTARDCHEQAIAAPIRLCQISAAAVRKSGFTEPALIAVLETSGGMATGQPQDACKATERGIPRRALTTDLQLTSAHRLVALAKSSSQRAAPARPKAFGSYARV